jgi:hypothetical protein
LDQFRFLIFDTRNELSIVDKVHIQGLARRFLYLNAQMYCERIEDRVEKSQSFQSYMLDEQKKKYKKIIFVLENEADEENKLVLNEKEFKLLNCHWRVLRTG